MHNSKASYIKWAGIAVTFLWQAAFIIGCFVMAVWMWPSQLLENPFDELTWDVALRAIVSVSALSVGITSLYLIAVSPFVRGYAELFSRNHN